MLVPLRPYQVDASRALQDWLSAGERELLLESPVGSGKTTTIKAMTAALLASGAWRLVVVLVPQNLLRDQWVAAGAWRIGKRRVALDAARNITDGAELTPDFWRTERGLVVITRQALTTKNATAILASLKRSGLSDVLVVADEGHHCADANQSGRMLETLRKKGAATLLVSATPFATAGNVGGPNCKAYRFPEYEYVGSFKDDDPSRPPDKFVIDRVFVGAAVGNAAATVDRDKGGLEDARAAEMIDAMAGRWKADGFPRAVFNIPRQAWAEPLEAALLKVRPKAALLNLVGEDIDADAKGRLARDSKVTRWADVKVSAVLSCVRMDEGIDWVPCSHVYNAGIPASPTLILQRWGRAARAKRKIEGYPKKWADARTLVFFTPPGTGEGDSWKAQLETAWLLGGYLADYNAAREWTRENVARGIVGGLPVPPSTPEVQEWQGRLAAQIQRSGAMTPKDARLWLVRKGVSSEVVEAVVKRAQMLVKEVRTAMSTLGLQIKPELRAEAERLIEETPLQSVSALGYMVSMTALGLKEIGERMRSVEVPPWHGMGDEELKVFAQKADEYPEILRGFTEQGLRMALHRRGFTWSAVLDRHNNYVRDLEVFVKKHGHEPNRRSADLEERKLARRVQTLRGLGKVPPGRIGNPKWQICASAEEA